MSDSRLRFSEKLALNVGPVPIRIALAVTFMWAGLGKILATFEPAEADLPRLSAMGVIGDQMTSPPSPNQGPNQEPNQNPAPTQDPSQPGQPGESGAGGLGQGDLGIVLVQGESEEPRVLRRVYAIALTIHKGAAPDQVDGEAPPPIVPSFAGSGRTPVYLAWAASITEIICAVLVFVGLFTRVGAVGLAGVMGVAMWLTTFGPAFQSDTAFLMFIPGHDVFDVGAWTTPLFQLALLGASLALAFTGPGALSAHHFLFVGGDGSRDADDYDDDDD
jgi:uncharacterized membrane protein YphA (DoxX/SURF4 family)